MTNEPGFRSHQIAVHYHLMHRDIETLTEELDVPSKFVSWRLTLTNMSQNEKKEQWKKVRLFMKESKSSLTKHFDRWVNELLPFGMGENCQVTSAIILRRFLELSGEQLAPYIPPKKNCIWLPQHDRYVRADELHEFLMVRSTKVPEKNDPFFSQLAKVVVSGVDLWENTLTPGIGYLQDKFKRKCLALPSNGHMSERGVKEAKCGCHRKPGRT